MDSRSGASFPRMAVFTGSLKGLNVSYGLNSFISLNCNPHDTSLYITPYITPYIVRNISPFQEFTLRVQVPNNYILAQNLY